MNFGTPPPDLRAVAPYLTRATELRKKEPIIAYYCLYYATQAGITIKTTQKESKAFLVKLMTSLEGLKAELKGVREVNSDAAASAYIEAFALKVFDNADAEDRLGGSNRSTAKKFLAAGIFLDLLKIFDNRETSTVDFEEKARYAKWKAADISKAFREGRVPQSGSANGDGLSIGDRPVSPPSDFDDLSLSSSAIGIPPSLPPEHPSPRKTLEHKLPLAGQFTKTPVRHAGFDGVWSNVATPGSEIPGGPASPSSFSLAAALNASQLGGSPKPRSGLNKVAAASPLNDHGEDTDPEDGDDGWSTIGNPFSRQNSVTIAGATPPDSAGAGASFTTNLASLSEEPSPLQSGVASIKPRNALNVPLPTSATSSPYSQPVAIPPSKHQDDPSKQVRFTPDTNEPRGSAHRRNGSGASIATTTTMVTSGTTLKSSLSDPGSGVSLAGNNGFPAKAGKALSSPSETVFGAQLPSPPSTVPKAPVPGQKSPASKEQPSASSEEDEWEQNRLSRIARLPDNRGSDSDGKYTGGGGEDLIDPTRPAGHGDSTPRRDTTRGNVREDSPEFNSSTFGFPRGQLPGVPSSPPADGWPGQGTYRGPPSDDGDLPNLPSAPPVAPSDQEIIPHVTIFTKPRPESERHPSSNNTVVHPPYDHQLHPPAPPMTRQQDMPNSDSRVQGHSRGPSQSSTATLPAHVHPYSQNYPPAPPIPKAPSPPHFQSPASTTSSTMPGYAPPNSAVSPTMGYTGASPNISIHHLPPPPPIPGQQYYPSGAQAPYAYQHPQYAADSYSGGWPTAGGHPPTINRSITPQSNGSHPSSGSYFPNGTAYEARTPPETLDPETVAKAQKHAKFAISALNFEDLDTARKELRRALEMLS